MAPKKNLRSGIMNTEAVIFEKVGGEVTMRIVTLREAVEVSINKLKADIEELELEYREVIGRELMDEIVEEIEELKMQLAIAKSLKKEM